MTEEKEINKERESLLKSIERLEEELLYPVGDDFERDLKRLRYVLGEILFLIRFFVLSSEIEDKSS